MTPRSATTDVQPTVRTASDAITQTLELRDVTRRWARQPRPVLDGICMSLAPGDRVLLLGANGAGKTTLLRVIAGMVRPTTGEVWLCGANIELARPESLRRIGLLAAGNSGLYARLTVRRQLEYWAAIALMPRAQRAPQIDAAIRSFALDTLADRRLDRMSMGQRQRVRIAMTFLHEPALALLDEPANSLDTEGIELLREALRAHQARGGATIWCAPTGDTTEVDADRRLHLVGGRLEPA